MKFLVQPPHNEKIGSAEGILRQNHAAIDHISIENIAIIGDTLI
jgi:hypothetical protein